MKILSKVKGILVSSACLIFILATQVQALELTQTYELDAGITKSVSSVKTMNTDKLGYCLLAVWPYGDKADDYTRIKLQANYGKSVIMSQRVISESTSMSTYNYGSTANLSINDMIKFDLCGNNPLLGAYAKVTLDWY